MDKKPAVFSIKARPNSMKLKKNVVKISQDCIFIGHFHRMIMVGVLPAVILFLVTVHTLLAAHECCSRPPSRFVWWYLAILHL